LKLINKQVLFILGISAGVVLIIAGMFFKDQEPSALPGICIGIGAGLFGMSIASLITYRLELKRPEAFVKKNREVNDERNTLIREKAGANTNSIFMKLICIATLVFALLNVELYVTITMAGLILVNGAMYVIYINYFNKKL